MPDVLSLDDLRSALAADLRETRKALRDERERCDHLQAALDDCEEEWAATRAELHEVRRQMNLIERERDDAWRELRRRGTGWRWFGWFRARPL